MIPKTLDLYTDVADEVRRKYGKGSGDTLLNLLVENNYVWCPPNSIFIIGSVYIVINVFHIRPLTRAYSGDSISIYFCLGFLPGDFGGHPYLIRTKQVRRLLN